MTVLTLFPSDLSDAQWVVLKEPLRKYPETNESWPAGTMCQLQRRVIKNVPFIVALPIAFDEDSIRVTPIEKVWSVWVRNAADAQFLMKEDTPIGREIWSADELPFRTATADEVQPWLDQSTMWYDQALKNKAQIDADRLHRLLRQILAVQNMTEPTERSRLQTSAHRSAAEHWHASGWDKYSFLTRQAHQNGWAETLDVMAMTPRSEAARLDDDAVRQEKRAIDRLARNRGLLAWGDAIGAQAAHAWIDEAVVTAQSFGGRVQAALVDADLILERLPPVEGRVWPLRDQERLLRWVDRTAQALRPWFDAFVMDSLTVYDDERVKAAQHLADAPWDQTMFKAWQRDALRLVVEDLLWQRKMEVDLRATLPAQAKPPVPSLQSRRP